MLTGKDLHKKKFEVPKKGRPKGERGHKQKTGDGGEKPKVGPVKKKGARRPNFVDEAAERLSLGKTTVKRAAARLKKSAPEVREARDAKEINATQVDDLIKLPAEQQVEVLPAVKAAGREETRAIVARKLAFYPINPKGIRTMGRMLTSLGPRSTSLGPPKDTPGGGCRLTPGQEIRSFSAVLPEDHGE